MLKKIIALGLVLICALIMLPYGFGLWNENMGIRGQITFAERAAATPEQTQADEDASPADSAAVDSDNQTYNGKDAIASEPSTPDQAQSEPIPEDISMVSSPDNSTGEGAVAPLPIEPVEAVENTENPESVQAPTVEANIG
ncbi:MAG: hypothetical protein CVU91_05830 [Firmicutes bacterium HGW-Firmicutes-16]|nr:MAG: hypothetical protein CVU91_05830 [Firmicutes bacterium HGW-Firmicutes-16]